MFRNLVFIFSLTLMFVMNVSDAKAAIYGEDNRMFTTQLKHVGAAKAALAVGSIGILTGQEYCLANKCSSGNMDSLAERVKNTRRDGGYSRLCEGEKFENAPTLGYATGFLIAPQYIMTAGHVAELDLTSNMFITFDHVGSAGAKTPYEVYKFEEIVFLGRRNTEFERYDYAIIKLDRPVKNRTPLSLKALPEKKQLTNLAAVGHPNGLPKIFSGGGSILRRKGKSIFYMNLDVMSGNSGSPVFDTSDWSVVGIHVDGPNDYEIKNGCKHVYVCQLPNCKKGDIENLPSGEAATEMGFLLDELAKQRISIDGIKVRTN